mmetsp:Transcript_26226/g.68135  ORF Transcript_26226/g.68135 Transcript_26226/m.68135 type:complete len:317 (-) Transcript_26226:9-959(-)
MAARILTLAGVVHQASSFAAPLSRPAGVVVDELLPLLDEGGTTRSRNKSPETIKQIDACLAELREAGRGAKVLDDPRLFGEYEIKYFDRSVDGGRDGGDDAVKKPSIAKRLRKAIFFLPFKAIRLGLKSTGTYQHVLEPKTIVNYVTFKFFGVPAAVTAKAEFTRETADELAAARALSNGTVPLSAETARVVFDAPRVSFGRRGRLNFEVTGPSAQPPVDLCTTYVDDRVRCGVAARGGKFVFRRYNKTEPADGWEALLKQEPVSGKVFFGLSVLGAAAGAVAPLPTLLGVPVGLFVAGKAAIATARYEPGLEDVA